MAKKRILIVGDSFFSPDKNTTAWQNLLAQKAKITNLACNGVGQYKILKQLHQTNVKKYDFVITGVTSPNRVHTETNPWYDLSHPTHCHADFIYEDVLAKSDSANKEYILWYFNNVFDLEYYQSMHCLLLNEINNYLSTVPHQLYTFFDINLPYVVNLHKVWQDNPGSVNHLNVQGNQETYNKILARLKFVLY